MDAHVQSQICVHCVQVHEPQNANALTLVLLRSGKFVGAPMYVQAGQHARGCADAHIRTAVRILMCVEWMQVRMHGHNPPQAELADGTGEASAAPTSGTRSAGSVRKPGLA